MRNLFVVGLDAFHLDLLGTIRGARDYAFHPLLDHQSVTRPPGGYQPFDELLARARRELDAFDGRIDGIIGYWDFPTTGLVPLLCREQGLPGAAPEALTRCEHKYWSRIVQREVVPELLPAFQDIDPFAPTSERGLDLPFPVWIKPIKSHSSFLGFRVHNPNELEASLARVREHIGRIATTFDQFLAHVNLPPEVRGIGGHHCIAEEIIAHGHQCTLEGYVHDGAVEVYGAVDSIRSGRHRSCFTRYQYPSSLPRKVRARMVEATDRVMRHIGYDNAAFNIEFYWSPRDDGIRLLEINTRISKSHSPLFLMVDGASNQQIPVELVLGRQPVFPHREGEFRLAGKFMLRIHEDGVIERSPTQDDLRRLRTRYPEARVRALAPAGTRLSHMTFQDSYSFEIGDLFLGADSRKELIAKGRAAERILDFRLRRPASEEAA